MDSIGLDPAHEDDAESFKVSAQIFDTLVRHPAGSAAIEPALATRWEASDGGRAWTFHLRRSVRFHDGTPLDAAAVVFSLDRQRGRPSLHPLHAVGGPYKLWTEFGLDDVVESIRAPDDSTVVIRLVRPFAPFLAYLTGDFASIVSPAAVRKWRDDFFKHPVGSGPFRFVEWVPDDHITLARNDAYWDGPPDLDRVVFRSIPENSTRFQALTRGDLDVMDGVRPDLAPRVMRSPGLVLVSTPAANTAYLAINNDRRPFDDARVRRALNLAIDVPAIVRALYAGYAHPAAGALPPGIPGYDPSLPPYAHDPEAARRLLASAGYPHGFACDLWSMAGPRYYMPQPLEVAEAIQADLRRVGVRAAIRTFEWGTYLDRLERGDHELALIGSGTLSGDPDEFLYALLDKDLTRYPAGNLCFYRGEAVHRLVTRARVETDQAARVDLYRRAERIVHDDAPWVPLVHASELAITKRGVHGFAPAAVGEPRLCRVWIENGGR